MPPPNLLLITADDMNWDAVGAFGCPDPDTTPNIDRLAAEGMRFNHGHVNIAVCWPSRSAMMTGRYPHRSGGEGFFNLRQHDVPILPALLRDGGYRVGILGKHGHSTPYKDFQWDVAYDQGDLGQGRNPAIYQKRAGEFMRASKETNQPFFLMLNSHDPHRPFYGNDDASWYERADGAAKPSRAFQPEEVTTPGFLTDLPEVRREIAEYYSSVRRCDDTVGATLDVLRELGLEDNTLVLFLSDNGMAFPFAKTNCYLNSTRTPWIMRWPEKIRPGAIDSKHFVTGIDIMPTFLEAAGVQLPEGMDGQSFMPVLAGESQQDREFAFTQFHQTAGRKNYPMRCVQNTRFGYIFNPWSNGERVFHNESQSGRTFAAMRDAAEQDPDIAARVELFLHRVPEEFYDFENDPNALNNLIDDPAYQEQINHLRTELETWMEQTKDPALACFRERESVQARESFVKQVDQELPAKR